MSQKKQTVRAKFRYDVYTRDEYTCRKCGYCSPVIPHAYDLIIKPKTLDAHHITDRNEIVNGGYVKENGISLCSKCHEIAEMYHEIGETEEGFYPEDLYKIIGSSKELAIKESEKL